MLASCWLYVGPEWEAFAGNNVSLTCEALSRCRTFQYAAVHHVHAAVTYAVPPLEL